MKNFNWKFWNIAFCIYIFVSSSIGVSSTLPPESSITETLIPTREMRAETIYMVRCMEELHLNHKNISLLDNKAILNGYLTELDPSKMVFLQKDVDRILKKFVPTLDVFVSGGSLIPAFTIFETFRSILFNRMDWIFSRLDQPFDFSKDETFLANRKDCNWLQTTEEADMLWEKRLKFEILNEAIALCQPKLTTNIKASSSSSENLLNLKNSTDPDASSKLLDLTGLENPKISVDSEQSEVTTNSDKSDQPKVYKNSEVSEKDESFEVEKHIDDKKLDENVIKSISGTEITEADVLDKVDSAIINVKRRYESWKRSCKEIDSWLVQEMFLNSISRMYDPHSSFLSKDSFEDFTIHIKNSLIGIGTELHDENGVCTVNKVTPGGPAQLSGEIKPGDKIVAIAQGDDGEFVDIIGLRLYKTVKLLRGPKDTVVRVKLETVGGDSKIVRLVRNSIKLNATRASAQYFELENNGNILKLGVIELPSFYGDVDEKNANSVFAHKDVASLISMLKEKNIDGLILDLRQNGGGLLSQAVSIAGFFIKSGPVVQVRDSFGRIDKLCDKDEKIIWTGPLAILSSSMSASASEILMGALKDHKRALIVGAKATYGKGSVQVALDMNSIFKSLTGNKDLGAAYVTIQKWYLPTGNSTQLKGVEADISLSGLDECFKKRESSYPYALEWDNIPAAEMNNGNSINEAISFVSPVLISKLEEFSKRRQETMEEFSMLRERISHFDNVVNKKEYPLSISVRLQYKKLEDDFIKSMTDKVNQLNASYPIVSQNISLPDIGCDTDFVDDKPKEDVDNIIVFDANLREGLRIVADWIRILDTENNDIPVVPEIEQSIGVD